MEDIRFEGVQEALREPQTGSGKDRRTQESGPSFEKVLKESLKEVNDLQNQAEEAIQELAQGRTEDLHRTMVLLEKADLSFKLMMRVRNKLLDAYNEIMRVQV